MLALRGHIWTFLPCTHAYGASGSKSSGQNMTTLPANLETRYIALLSEGHMKPLDFFHFDCCIAFLFCLMLVIKVSKSSKFERFRAGGCSRGVLRGCVSQGLIGESDSCK